MSPWLERPWVFGGAVVFGGGEPESGVAGVPGEDVGTRGNTGY